MKKLELINSAKNIRTDLALKFLKIGVVKIDNDPHTIRVIPTRIANSVLEILRSSWMTRMAGGKIPLSTFT